MAEKKSRVNEAGNYTKPGMRKRLFNSIKSGGKGGKPGQWSARKAQMLAKAYKAKVGTMEATSVFSLQIRASMYVIIPPNARASSAYLGIKPSIWANA